MSVARTAPRADDELYETIVALLYMRVSTDRQEREGSSLPEQDAANRGYVAARPTWAIGGVYQDVQSGMKPTRAGYQALLADVKRRKVARERVVVVVKFQDRLGRDMAEAIRVFFELTRLGVDVHVVDSNGAPSEDEYFIRAYAAHKESVNIGKRVRSVIHHVESLGWHKPGGAAWGYTNRDATADERRSGAPKRVLDVDPQTAPYAVEAWRRFAAGESVRSITGWAQTLPPAARGFDDERGTKARDLSFNAVRKILQAPVYVARFGPFDARDPDAVLDRPTGRWPALVDDDTWRRATEQRKLGARMPRQARGDYPLTGLLRCSRCGGRMSGRLTSQNRPVGSKRREYTCTSLINLGAKNADRRCRFIVSADAIETLVLGALVGMLRAAGDPASRRRIVAEIRRQEHAESGEPVGRAIKQAETERAKLLARLDSLLDRRADGEIDAETYARGVARNRPELDRVEQRIVELRGRIRETKSDAVALLLPTCAAWADVIERAEASAIRDTLAHLFESIAPLRIERGVYDIDYRWTATGEQLLGAAIVALQKPATDDERALHDLLVRVDHLARTRWSTLSDETAAG